jgi:hypothetical protein
VSISIRPRPLIHCAEIDEYLTDQARALFGATKAVTAGNLGTGASVDTDGAQGELLGPVIVVDAMMGYLGTLAEEVTCVARETGAEGRLGAQARVDGADGAWKVTSAISPLISMAMRARCRM